MARGGQSSFTNPPPAWVPYVVLTVSLVLTLAAAALVEWNASGRDQTRFETAAQAIESRIVTRFEAYATILHGVDGLVSASGVPSRSEFFAYLQPLRLQEEYPGIQGVGWARRIPPQQLGAIEQSLQWQLPGFSVWPKPARDEHFAIVLIEPLDRRNQAAVGFDMFSEPVRRQAMERARDTGRAALSGQVTLVQEIEEKKQSGFLLYVPVYEGIGAPGSVAERRRKLLGFAFAPFRAQDFFTELFGKVSDPSFGFEVFDGRRGDADASLHLEKGTDAGEGRNSLETWRHVELAGHVWSLRVFTRAPFSQGSRHQQVPWVLGFGLIISGVLFALSRAQARAAAEAALRAEELKVAVEELSESDRRKDEFLAMLAHELRNPLAPVLTAIQLMARKLQGGGDVSRERTVLERQVRHIIRLVDDLLDVSRITRGKILLQQKPVSLGQALTSAVDVVRPLVDQKKHTLELDLPEQPVWVEADPVRLEQILTNLLNNAAKYTPEGGHIRAALTAEAGNAVVRVRDDGIGIAPEAQRAVFELFVQGTRGLDRTGGGLGIGLTLVKRLVEMHAGQVAVSSDGVGRGSEFTVRLPLGAPPVGGAESALQAGPPSSSLGPTRVLVVDDNLDATAALEEFLTLEGAEVAVAHSGPEALERLGEFKASVVLLDIGLPQMDGYEVAKKIRERPELADTRLIALTGYGQKRDVERALGAGFDLHLVKPVDLQTLRDALDRVQRG